MKLILREDVENLGKTGEVVDVAGGYARNYLLPRGLAVQASTKNLKEQERIVLSLYYFEEMKLHEIASVLGLTESRVSQIRTKALGRLRTELAHLRLPA